MFLTSYKDLPELLSGERTGDAKARRLKGIDHILKGRKWVHINDAKNTLRGGVLANTDNYLKGFASNQRPYQDLAVPYEFCTDDRADFQLGCTTGDFGSTQREVVNYQFDVYRALHLRNRFKRHRIHRMNETIWYFQNFLYSTLMSASRAFRFYSIYRFWDLGSYTDDLREAALDSANFFAEVLATPEPGKYCYVGLDDSDLGMDVNWFYDIRNTYVPSSSTYSDNRCDEPITIQPGMAQYYNYDFTDEYDFRINYVGTFIDKLVASQSLFSISSNFLYNQFLTDTRASNVSYWTLFRDEMLDMTRGLFLNDYSAFGGLYDKKGNGTGNYQAPHMIERNAFTYGTTDPSEGKPRIFTSISFNHEFNILAYSMIQNSNWQDRELNFADYVRVGVGDREKLDYGDATVVEFVHPETHQRYVAPQTADGQSITAEMLTWANALSDRWEESREIRDARKAEFDRVRETYEMSATFLPSDCDQQELIASNAGLQNVCTAMTEYRKAKSATANRKAQLQDVMAKVDLVRWVRGIMGPDVLN